VSMTWLVERVFEQAERDYKGLPFDLVTWSGKRTRYGAKTGAPAFTFHFKTREALLRGLVQSSLGLGDAYVRGDFDVEGDLEEALYALSQLYVRVDWDPPVRTWIKNKIARSLSTERGNIEHHYGIGDDFYRTYLDKHLQYSCAYFRTPDDDIETAQAQKVAHTGRKLYIQPGMRVLEIGCGWGQQMFHNAEKYGASCVGLTICENQAKYIREEAKRRKLPVEVHLTNYQEFTTSEKFDRIVTVGMMCHVGQKRQDAFYDKLESFAAPKSVVLTHCVSKMRESTGSDPFVEKYIFPGYWFFSAEGQTKRVTERGFNILDVENLRRHYVYTLRRWRHSFLTKQESIKARFNLDDKFIRTWDFYMCLAMAGFRHGHMNLLQMVMSKGTNDDYPMTRDFQYAPGLLDAKLPAADEIAALRWPLATGASMPKTRETSLSS
jgi:cyclopropane-fatty-acyl-phospholipid synthase